ncbi:MAG: TIGR03086 family metal-binding protein [Acidimicrobiales bacterium]
MTTNTITQTSPETEAIFRLDDPRVIFAKAVALAGAVIGATRADQLDNRTPCSEFRVRELLGHIVTALEHVAVVGRGHDPYGGPVVVREVPDDGWLRAWIAAAHDARTAWSDDATLTRVVRLPWAEQTGAATLAGYVNEVSVHTWDLATATGRRPQWDSQVLELALDAIGQVLPADGRGERGAPFADPVEVPADAPLIDRLVAWNGRRP